MSIQRKSVELIHTDGTVRITFEENRKSGRDSIVIETPYHIQTRSGELHFTRAEFIILSELIEAWFKGNRT